MAFVNEYIPPADKIKYGILEDSDFYRAGGSQWTVDRDRDMFLVFRGAHGPEGARDEIFWAFYWRGQLLDVRVKNLKTETDHDDNVQARKKILHIGGLSDQFASLKPQIVGDLKEALVVYGVAGLLVPAKSYRLDLEE